MGMCASKRGRLHGALPLRGLCAASESRLLLVLGVFCATEDFQDLKGLENGDKQTASIYD